MFFQDSDNDEVELEEETSKSVCCDPRDDKNSVTRQEHELIKFILNLRVKKL